MEGKSFSLKDEKKLKVNDLIDEVLSDEDLKSGILVDAQIKDDAKAIMEQNIERNKRNETFKKQTDKISEELREKVRTEKRKAFRNSVLYVFTPAAWVTFIQYFEDLLYVMFIDVTLGAVLFSLMSIAYIIYNYNGDNLEVFICKIGGLSILCILGMIIQLNLTPNKEK